MATKQKKAARSATSAKPNKATKPAKPPKPARSAAAGKSRPAAGKKGRKPRMAYEDARTGEPVLDEEDRPGFFERLRARRQAKAVIREEKAKAREEERLRADVQRQLEAERQRKVEEEQAVLRAEQERQAQARRKVEERKAAAARRRAEAKAARQDEARRAAEEKAARAAEAARLAEEKAAAAEAAKQRRTEERKAKRAELAAREAQLAAEQAAKDAEDEVERRRLAANKKWQPEPDLEFEEPSTPVSPDSALVPSKSPPATTELDRQAELMATELSRRRSKPLVIVGEEPPVPMFPKAAKPTDDLEQVEFEETAPLPAERRVAAPATESFGFSMPDAFLLLANEGGWDERVERTKEGSLGGALAGSLVLELLLQGAVMVQRDRLVLTGDAPDDPELLAIVQRLRWIREKKGDLTTLQQLGLLAKRNRELLGPFKQRLATKGLVAYGTRRHLGLFHRSWVEVKDTDAQERLRNRLRRAIAGGGTPEAPVVLLLGLLDASGLFATVVPDEAADYNRKRLNGLLGGRDIMGYKVDPRLKATQEMAVRSVLGAVRVMTVKG